MKTHLTDLNLPTSVWQALHRVDNLLAQTLSWPKRLEEINSILIDELECEALRQRLARAHQRPHDGERQQQERSILHDW